MKFACDKCKTRYSISDEKVRGKVLKIRCKNCKHIVEVRGSSLKKAEEERKKAEAANHALLFGGNAGQDELPTMAAQIPESIRQRGQETFAPLPGREDIEWYVAIKGTQHGPMPFSEVVGLFKSGAISARSYIWAEDLPSWTRIRDVRDFAAVLGAASTVEKKSTPPPPPPPAAEESGGMPAAQVPARQETRPDHAQLRTDESAPSPHGSPYDSGEGLDSLERDMRKLDEARQDDAAAMSGSGSGLGSPSDPFAAAADSPLSSESTSRESTRVFIMRAGLANRKEKHRAYAAAAVVGILLLVGLFTLDWYGLVQIPGLHSAVDFVALKTGTEVPENRKRLAMATAQTNAADAEMKCKLLGNCPKEENAVKGAGSKKTRRSNGKSAGSANLDALGGMKGVDLEGAFEKGGSENSDPLSGTFDSTTGAAVIDPFAKQDPEKAKAIAAQLGDRKAKQVQLKSRFETPTVAGGSNLDPENVAKVFKEQGQGAVTQCLEQAIKRGDKVRGKKRLVLVIESNGRVSGANFNDPETNASPIGECIKNRAKKWKFAAFAGEAEEAEIPITLTTGF
jgi:predicted Zn finger-like uncharacterized protein